MDRQQIGVKLAFDGLALDFKIEGFNDRLILQKAIYLAQAAGVKLGYYFHWYLRGPYCPALTRDAYGIRRELDEDMDDSQSWELDAPSSERLQKLCELFPPDRSQMARELELLASVHFLIDRQQVLSREPAALVDTLRRYGKDFTQDEVAAALRGLIQHGMLS